MPLKLIGAGLGRTGTLSLKLALEQIGFGPCYHMAEVLINPACNQEWVHAADGRADWVAIFAGYSSTVDYPGCTFWRELMQYYPTAKVLLSVRDPSDWFDSTQKTIFSEGNVGRILQSPMAEFFRKTVFNVVGDRIHDRDYMIAAFNAHAAEVTRGVPKERLLVYEVAHGWAPLCNFLGVAIPDGPFPRVNTREEFGGRRAAGGPGGEPLDDAAVADMVRAELARLREKI